MNLTYPIENKIALVTGANRGIGKAILEGFLAAGAQKVYAAVRKPESVQNLVDQYGEKVVPVEVDMTKPETITAAAKLASDVQVVVNNAGVLRGNTLFDDKALDDYEFQFETNVLGLLHLARAFAPVLKSNGGGAFVQLNSVASLRNFEQAGLYAASKAAAYSITQSLRDLLSEQNTLVVSVHPGPINTDMAAQAQIQDIAEPPSQVADAIIGALDKGEFFAWTDTMSRQFGEAYDSFAQNVILASFGEE